MIPSIEDILAMLVKGECTQDRALQWIGSHIELATSDAALRDHFASTAAIGRDADGNIQTRSAVVVMGEEPPPFGDTEIVGNAAAREVEHQKSVKAMQWWCDAEARIRYLKAESMMRARII